MEEIINKIRALNISDEERNAFIAELKSIGKKIAVFEFKYNRTVVDKSAITNVLNATIKEIEDQKAIIEKSKDEIAKNLQELDLQKQIVERKNTDLAATLKHLEETQSQLVQAEKMASLGQLTAGVAHEINNPINFVSANVDPLRMDLDDLIEVISIYRQTVKEKGLEEAFIDAEKLANKIDIEFTVGEINDLLSGIEIGASRTSEIVRGLKNFSRLDQDVFKKANLNEGIESTLTILHSVYRNRIEIIREFGDIPEVDCFPGQINQVLMNLLSNAIQAIPEKGEIYIKTQVVGTNVLISIRDTGTGMSDEVRKKIFDPFFTTKEVGKGTGLGLSISYGIIEKHKGKIEVDTIPDQGTEFFVTLPIMQ